MQRNVQKVFGSQENQARRLFVMSAPSKNKYEEADKDRPRYAHNLYTLTQYKITQTPLVIKDMFFQLE